MKNIEWKTHDHVQNDKGCRGTDCCKHDLVMFDNYCYNTMCTMTTTEKQGLIIIVINGFVQQQSTEQCTWEYHIYWTSKCMTNCVSHIIVL